MSKADKMPELVGESLIEFGRGQLKITRVRIVNPILKSSVQDGSCRNDFSCRRIESALKGKSNDFWRETEPVENAAVRIEHDGALAPAIAGIRVRRLAGNITCDREKIVNCFDVTICGEASYRKQPTCVGQREVGRRHRGPIGK